MDNYYHKSIYLYNNYYLINNIFQLPHHVTPIESNESHNLHSIERKCNDSNIQQNKHHTIDTVKLGSSIFLFLGWIVSIHVDKGIECP